MSRITIPISGQVLWSTGDVRLWADIRLLVKDKGGNFIGEVVRVDSGTEITTFPAYHARLLDLPIPASASPGVTHSQTGLEIRSGVLRFRVAGMDPTEYVTPCLFLGDPGVAPVAARPATFPKKLLQPLALVERLRIAFDKDVAGGSLYGEITIEKK
jgi:hypothetical protein